MNRNEFSIQRTAVGEFTVPLIAATLLSGVIIPAGAIVTGIRIMPPAAPTGAGSSVASATVLLKAGAEALCATVEIKNLPTETVVATTAVTAASGKYLATGGELLLEVQASNNSSASGVFNYYVDYLYVGS